MEVDIHVLSLNNITDKTLHQTLERSSLLLYDLNRLLVVDSISEDPTLQLFSFVGLKFC